MDRVADRRPVVKVSSPRTVATVPESGVSREQRAHADAGVAKSVAGADSDDWPATLPQCFAAADILIAKDVRKPLPVFDGPQEAVDSRLELTERARVHGSADSDYLAEGFLTPLSDFDAGSYYRGLYTQGPGYLVASDIGYERLTDDAPVSFRTPECKSPASFDRLFSCCLSLRIPTPQSERSTPRVESSQPSANVLPDAAQRLIELEQEGFKREESLPLAPERSNSFDTVFANHEGSVTDDHPLLDETVGNTPEKKTRRFFRRLPTKADIEADKAIVRKWFEKTANLRTITVTAGSRHVTSSQHPPVKLVSKSETKEFDSYFLAGIREFDNNGYSSRHSSNYELPIQNPVVRRDTVKAPSLVRRSEAPRTELVQPLSKSTTVSAPSTRQVHLKRAELRTPPAPKVELTERRPLPPRLIRKPLIFPRRRRRRTMDANGLKDVVRADDGQHKDQQQYQEQHLDQQNEQPEEQRVQQPEEQQYEQQGEQSEEQQYEQQEGQSDAQQYRQQEGQQQPEDGQEEQQEGQQSPEEGQEETIEQDVSVNPVVPRISALSGEYMPMAEIILVTTSLGGIKHQFFQSNLARHLLDCKGVVYYVVDANRDFTTATTLKDHELFEKWNATGILKTETIGQRSAVVIPQLIIDGVSVGNTTAMQDLEDDGDLDYIIARMLCPSCLAEKPQDAVQCPSCNVQYDMLVPPEYCDGVDIQRICQGAMFSADDNAE
ncbi:Theoredoxin domain containing protein [Babesia ovata]|uniref:Theoredoxin domain containing protein n=1 Tax=Babesia ovata TaxID=189622 RepID=A0A2H6KA90_9APIC|nr:Theoredoxin domain containing protein [Babesia ovata]GBE59869.1 Theoredoxin domain containing protein [Babesia ovata]